MTCPPLVTALVLASVAGSTVLAVVLAPPTLWLAPDLQPLALALSAAWAAWRLMALDRALAHRRSWHQAPGWGLAPEALASATTPLWWPAWLRRCVTWAIAAVSAADGITQGTASVTIQDPLAITYGRFLDQSTFGPTPQLMAHVRQIGIPAFLDEQFATPESSWPALKMNSLIRLKF